MQMQATNIWKTERNAKTKTKTIMNCRVRLTTIEHKGTVYSLKITTN